MIKVVQLQYSTASGGSSAIRLQKFFLKNNIESSIISLLPDSLNSDEKIKYSGKWMQYISKLDNRLQAYLNRKVIKSYGSFSYPVLGCDVTNFEEIKNADFIYIHWALNGFLNLKSIAQIAALKKPVILVMHDMWNITGGCHHSFTCEKYKTACNTCQMFLDAPKNDRSSKEFRRKLKLYSRYNNLYFVSPSKWLYECAKQSALTKNKPLYYIPNAIDNKFFKPIDKLIAKNFLNINTDEIVIAFGAVSIESPYKGWVYMQKALEILHQQNEFKNISVLIFGSDYSKEVADAIPFKIKFMGYLRDVYSTMFVYNAADVFIVPSVADNLPTTVQESLCCGTPVVGFEVGGIPDMIKHKENGYLAKYKDAADIVNGIKFCLQNKTKGYLLSEFEPDATVQKHIEMMESIKNSIQ
ncbi:glycosyltransferase [Ferruginibacter sp.]|nr:glycosyltransferase [Ferruginibacter sp.]